MIKTISASDYFAQKRARTVTKKRPTVENAHPKKKTILQEMEEFTPRIARKVKKIQTSTGKDFTPPLAIPPEASKEVKDALWRLYNPASDVISEEDIGILADL